MANEFLKELDIEGVAEVIAERFDSAVDFIHSNAVVYGGAIRDVLAGMPLEGDLDIATDGYSYKHTIKNFRKSTKWTEQGRKWHPTPRTFKRTLSTAPELSKEATSSPYKSGGMPVADITSFVTFDSAKIQIIMAKGQTDNSSDAALEIVKHVDFICCGLMMNNTGRVFEVLEGAYTDCKNRVLRLNKAAKNINVDNLKERIVKLKKRGWESKINISAIKRKMERTHKASIANQKRLTKSQQKHKELTESCSFIEVKGSKVGPLTNYSIYFSRREYTINYAGKGGYKNFAGLNEILHVMSNAAAKLKMKISHEAGLESNITIRILEEETTSKRANSFAREFQHRLEQLAFSYSGTSKKAKRLAPSHGDAYDSYGDVYKKEVPLKKKASKVRKSYAAFADSLSDVEVSTKLHEKPSNIENSCHPRMPEEVPEVATKAEHSTNDTGVETMSFKATMMSDGQIAISSLEIDPNIPIGEVTIDVDSLPPEAAQRLKNALGDMNSRHLNPSDVVSLVEMSLEERDSVDVRTIGEERSEDICDTSSPLERGEGLYERDRRR